MTQPEIAASWERCPVCTTQCTRQDCAQGCAIAGPYVTLPDIAAVAGKLSEEQRRGLCNGTWRDVPGAVTLICLGIIEMPVGERSRLMPFGECLRAHLLSKEQDDAG